MTPRPWQPPLEPTRYQDFIAFVRRFDRDAVLLGLAAESSGWDGSTHDAQGRVRPFLPWNVAGAAASVITRGTVGGARPTPEDLARLCYLYSNLQHPGTPGDLDFALQLVGRFLYQQWPYQRLSLKEWARPVALYADTLFPASYSPEVMSDSWDEQLLGCTVREFVSVGFCLYAAANTGGRYPLIWDAGLLDVLDLHGGATRFDDIVQTNFLTDIETFKSTRRDHLARLGLTPGQEYIREPFAYNPLISRPFVGGIVPGEWLAPSVSTIELRTSTIGILYSGIEKWGEAFTHDAGHLFEQYVGRQLRLIPNATVLPEVPYRTSQGDKLSVDWIVVLADAILLIECKSSIPATGVREGLDNFVEAHGRLAKGVKQINTTASAIVDRRPEFATVPEDRPVVGLVVTLGNFDMANDLEIRAGLPSASVPTAIVGIDFVEDLVTLNSSDLEALLATAPQHVAENSVLEPRSWFTNVTVNENSILQAAFDSVPIIAHVSTSNTESTSE